MNKTNSPSKSVDLSSLEFKKLDKTQAFTLIEWARREGWNPGKHDAELFWQTDKEGFYGYLLDGQLVAGGSLVSYGGKFGFMGLFIVHPNYRHQGIGGQLWTSRRDTLLHRLESGASIGMDGVMDMQPFYAKGGFEILFRDERYCRQGEVFPAHEHVYTFTPQYREQLLQYDTNCFGVERKDFILPWIEQAVGKTFIYIQNNVLVGFAVIRETFDGYKIGPLFADHPAMAEALYRTCLNAAPEQNVYLDIPVVNPAACLLVKKYKADYVFECARMYYGTPPDLPIDKVFGITTFELG